MWEPFPRSGGFHKFSFLCIGAVSSINTGTQWPSLPKRAMGFYVCAVLCVHLHGTSLFKPHPRRLGNSVSSPCPRELRNDHSFQLWVPHSCLHWAMEPKFVSMATAPPMGEFLKASHKSPPAGFEPGTSRFPGQHSSTEPLPPLFYDVVCGFEKKKIRKSYFIISPKEAHIMSLQCSVHLQYMNVMGNLGL